MTVPRYLHIINHESPDDFVLDRDGDYVLYSDHLQDREALVRENERLRSTLLIISESGDIGLINDLASAALRDEDYAPGGITKCDEPDRNGDEPDAGMTVQKGDPK